MNSSTEYDSSDDIYVAVLEQNNTNKIAPQNMNIPIGITEYNLLVDSGSGLTVIKLSLAKDIMYNCIHVKWSD